MRTLLGLSPLLLAATGLFAQSGSPAVTLMLQQPASRNCPINLSASRLPGGGMAEVTSGPRPQGQSLHVAFGPRDARGIIQADLILYGLSGRHVIPAATGATAEATETFSVSPAAGADRLYSSVVYFRKLTGVDWVELKSLTFADGTAWHTSATSSCRVAPNSFHLVAAR